MYGMIVSTMSSMLPVKGVFSHRPARQTLQCLEPCLLKTLSHSSTRDRDVANTQAIDETDSPACASSTMRARRCNGELHECVFGVLALESEAVDPRL